MASSRGSGKDDGGGLKTPNFRWRHSWTLPKVDYNNQLDSINAVSSTGWVSQIIKQLAGTSWKHNNSIFRVRLSWTLITGLNTTYVLTLSHSSNTLLADVAATKLSDPRPGTHATSSAFHKWTAFCRLTLNRITLNRITLNRITLNRSTLHSFTTTNQHSWSLC